MKKIDLSTKMAVVPMLLFSFASLTSAAEKRVCVEVVLQESDRALPEANRANDPQEKPPAKEALPAKGALSDPKTAIQDYPWETPPAAPAASKKGPTVPTPPVAPPAFILPVGQTPVLYLKRLIEHFVTHEVGFEAVTNPCEEKLHVELYPLDVGWTIFARYSGTGREERVDQLQTDELSQFAERAVLALLYDVPISSTIKRDNVLRADSKKSVQRVKGTNHFVIGLGTQLRGGMLSTATNLGDGSASEELRLFSPMTISTGYRGKFENWGVEAIAQLGIGTSRTAARKNDLGGHIDFGGDFGLALHFLRYLNPRGLTSFYLGGGSTFELLWFSSIVPKEERYDNNRNTLLGGGLDVDLLFGFEFMRASSVQFFLQGEIQLPAYVVQTDDDNVGGIHTWFPGFGVKLGMVF
jgi:hypothetical protein